MIVNLNKFIKNNKIISEKKIKEKIKKIIKRDEENFIDVFYDISKKYNWEIYGKNTGTKQDMLVYNKKIITNIMTDLSYTIISAELEYFVKNKKYKEDGWCINSTSTGRIQAQPSDFENKNMYVWIEIDFSCTL